MKVITLFVILVVFLLSEIQAKMINVPTESHTIQNGINSALDGDTVLIQPGNYFENINFRGKKIVVTSLYLTTNKESYISNTIINGKENFSIITFENGEDRESCLIGLTIQNGKDDWSGGGIYCEYASPTLKHLIIKENEAGGGGGIFCIDNSNPYLQNVLISNNKAEKGGGFMCMSNSNPILVNVTIVNNDSDQGKGLICCGSQPFIVNSVIVDEIYCTDWSKKNTIVFSHSNIAIGSEGFSHLKNTTINWLDENLNMDIGFIDASAGNYKLKEYSNCIDRGLIYFVWQDDTFFTFSENEYNGSAPDLGAFEFKNIVQK